MKKFFYPIQPKYVLNSISFRLLLLILTMVVPIIGIFIYSNVQSRSILISQIKSTHENMLQSYAYQLDFQLETAASETVALAVTEDDPQIIATGTDGFSAQYAKVRLKNLLQNKVLSGSFISGYFMQITEADGYPCLLYTINSRFSAPDAETLTGLLADVKSGNLQIGSWFLYSISGEDYLFFLTRSEDTIYAGAYIRIASLLQLFSPSDSADSHLYLLPGRAVEELSGGLEAQTVLVKSSLENAEFSFAETFSLKESLASFPFLQRFLPLVSALLIALVLLLLLLIHGIVTVPLLRLTNAMHQLKGGNLDYRIPERKATSEITLVNQTFNRMAGEIQRLKIDVYEEQLKAQKAQLHSLQLQIRPHFLINTLNMVYNLIETGRQELAKQLIQYSVNFFRYMVKVEDELVPLEEEIRHVEAYLGIQSLRYEGQFDSLIETDPMLRGALIPPVLLQTFVENSIKYALQPDSTLHIRISITSFEKEFTPYVKLIIRDNGAGYPKEYLDALNEAKSIRKADGIHIGIRNTLQKLQLLFGERIEWHFSNRNGAVSEIILPLSFSEQAEEEPEEEETVLF